MRLKSNLCLKTSDVLVIGGEDIGGDGVPSLLFVSTHPPSIFISSSMRSTYWWDLIWQLNILSQSHLPSLKRTLQVHLLDLLAQINRRPQQGDDSVLDDDVCVCALGDILL